MLVRKLTLDGFRNLHPTVWTPHEGVNILYGDNAQGKTNLLEACWLFTGGKSFRGAKDAEMKAFGTDRARLEMDFDGGGRSQTAEITITDRRRATLNGLSLPSATKLAGVFCGVVFSPAHLSLIKDGPAGRRRFVDGAYCQLRPGYIGALQEYTKALTQRNAFLRQNRETPVADFDAMLGLWDHTLAAAGARIVTARRRYIERLQPVAAAIYNGLSGGREQLTLRWDMTAADDPIAVARQLEGDLNAAHRADRGAGFTTVGPHREDLQVFLNAQPARVYGSQGQQRSVVLALKLAEATLLGEVTGEPPVAFLDDVMSELDVSRQDYILNHLGGWQVFITCCEPSSALRMTAGKVFHIKQGVLSE